MTESVATKVVDGNALFEGCSVMAAMGEPWREWDLRNEPNVLELGGSSWAYCLSEPNEIGLDLNPDSYAAKNGVVASYLFMHHDGAGAPCGAALWVKEEQLVAADPLTLRGLYQCGNCHTTGRIKDGLWRMDKPPITLRYAWGIFQEVKDSTIVVDGSESFRTHHISTCENEAAAERIVRNHYTDASGDFGRISIKRIILRQ